MDSDELAARIRAARKRAIFSPSASESVALNRCEIEHLIPHRDPFLLVDSLLALSLENRTAAGRRRIDPADPLFSGHFPGQPVYPGVLQLEIMGQLGLCLLGLVRRGRRTVEETDRPEDIRALKVHHAVFLDVVRPGDELEILARVIEMNEYTAVCEGQLVRNGTICCYAVMEVYFVGA